MVHKQGMLEDGERLLIQQTLTKERRRFANGDGRQWLLGG